MHVIGDRDENEEKNGVWWDNLQAEEDKSDPGKKLMN